MFNVREINRRLNDENHRLIKKKDSVDAVYDAHKRNQMYKESQAFRMDAYRKMAFVGIFIIAIFVGLSMVAGRVSSTIVYLVSFIVFIIGAYYLLIMYADVERRDKFDYNKISPNYVMSSTNLDKTTGGGGMHDCIGEQCCDEGEYFKDGLCQAEYYEVQELGELNYEDSPWGTDYSSIPTNPQAKWIWDTKNSATSAAGDTTITFVRSWNNTYYSSIDAIINILVDNRASIRLNGSYVAEHTGTTHGKYPIKLKPGLNTFEVRANNTGSGPSSAGLFITVTRSVPNDNPDAEQQTKDEVLLSTNTLWKFTKNKGYITESVWANLDGRYNPGDYERLTGGNPISSILTKDEECDNKCANQQECKTTECKHYLDPSTKQCFCRAKVPYESVYPSAIAENFETRNKVQSYYKKPTFTKI